MQTGKSELVAPVNASEHHLELIGLSKRFGDFVALSDVSLRVRRNSFHALLGENGAGKSTLVKCVIGYQKPSAGELLLDDRQVSFESTREAHRKGLGMVYQRFTLVENMTVAENLVLVRDRVPSVVDWKAELAQLSGFMDAMPFRVPLRVPVHSLSAGEKQKLEILKQLYLRRTLLFLDEPTSVLTPGEADEVLGLLHAMTRKRELTVLIITHKFREVTAFADDVSVLRRGKLVATGPLGDYSVGDLSKLMVGDETLRKPAPRSQEGAGAVRLSVDKLSANDDTGVPALRGLSLSVRAGEILGLAGVSGNGQRELVEVLAGQREKTAGVVQIAGVPYAATRAQIRELRVKVIPEVPLDNACVASMSVAENIALRDYDVAPIKRAGCFVSRRAIEDKARPLIARFSVKTPSATAPIRDLSGGNIQRAVLARELSEPSEVLIAVNPCFGLDFAASSEIRAQLVDARNRGTAVLLISEDLDELLELSDRLSVIFDGAISYETDPATTAPAIVGKYMAGHV
ncbi:MAG: putative transporter [Myxococcaceae bacterium]|nr:putative transporter [Myxococcaceae bacterium]